MKIMKDLTSKRQECCLIILATVVGSTLVAAAPKANLDASKQLFLTVADVAMCMVIWDIYFAKNLYQKKITFILLELASVIILSAITAYIAARGIMMLRDQLITWFGGLAWGVMGAIAALAASALGFAWTFYCDDLYRNKI
jgi:hypothetical protein